MKLRLLIALLITFSLLVGCGGSSNNDTLDYEIPELRIISLTMSDFDIDFDSETTGLYELELDSDVETIDMSFALSADAQKGEIHYTLNGTYQDELESSDNAYSLSIDIEEGTNTLQLTLIDEDEIVSLVYNFQFYRIYSSASISTLPIYELPDGDSASDYEPTFESDIYSYEVNVLYDTCSVVAVPEANSTSSQITESDEDVDSGESIYKNLEVGRNFLDIYVTSENGEREERYEFEIVREEPESDDRLENSRLKSLSFSEIDLDYYCGVTSYAISINNDVHFTTLNLEPEVDGATIWVGDEVIDPNESFAIDIEDDEEVISIVVESPDGSATTTYNVELFRRSSNYTYVETIDELAYALLNARPNDYIEIAEGDYDISELEDVDLVNGSLTTLSSGSALQPIIVTVETEGETTLSRSDDLEAPLMVFSGSHWQLFGLNISNADYGIELNGAEQVMISDFEFSDLSQAAVIDVGGEGNMIRLSRFENIGSESADTSYIELSSTTLNADIRQNTFVMNDASYGISIDESSSSTIIESNSFTHDESMLNLNHSLIKSTGANSSIFYNQFDFSLQSFNAPLISFDVEVAHETGAYVYENRIEIEGTTNDVTFVSAGNDLVYLHLSETASSDVVNSGDNIQSWTPPSYKIVMSEDEDWCFSLYQDEDVDYDSESDENFLAVDICDDSLEQSWTIEVGESAPYIKFKNDSVDDDYAYLSTLANAYNYCGFSEDYPSVFLDEDYNGFGQHWLLKKSNYDLSIRSQIVTDYGLTLADSQPDVDDKFSICPSLGASSQSFSLVPL